MGGIPEYMKRVVGWERTNTAVLENAADLPHLDGKRAELEQVLNRFKEVAADHAAFAASKLEAGSEIRDLLRVGETLVDFIRPGVRQHYGLDSDKLVEFGMQPNRGRSRAPKLPEPPPPPVESVATPDITQ